VRDPGAQLARWALFSLRQYGLFSGIRPPTLTLNKPSFLSGRFSGSFTPAARHPQPSYLGPADHSTVLRGELKTEPRHQFLISALDIVFIAIVCSIIAIKIRESSNLYIFIIVTSLVYAVAAVATRKARGGGIRPTVMDLSLFFVVLVEAVSYAKSTYLPNSLTGLEDVIFLFLFYCLVRSGLRRDFQRTAIFVFLSLLGLWISSRALYSFWLHYRRLQALGFTDLTDFKHLFGIVGSDGYSTGERITTLLLFLPFPLMLLVRFRRHRAAKWVLLCPVLTIIAALSVSFSRAVYASIGAFFVIADLTFWRCRLFPMKTILRFNAVVLLVLIGVLAPVWKSVLTTAAIVGTNSQVRSIEGRGETWRNSMEMAKRHPLYGIGAGNFPMQYDFYSESHSTLVLSSYDFFLQLLLEKGAVGLTAYVLTLAAFFWISYKKLKRRNLSEFHTAIIALSVTGCLAVLVRDLTFSSLLINKGASVLLWFGFANTMNSET
jgi:O-antigen ligase